MPTLGTLGVRTTSGIESVHLLYFSYAGNWNEGFDGQGGVGYLWSSSAHPGDAGGAFLAGFGASEVVPGGSGGRAYGVAVRCLLN